MASLPVEKGAVAEGHDSQASEHEIEKSLDDAQDQGVETLPPPSPRKVHGIAVGMRVDKESSDC